MPGRPSKAQLAKTIHSNTVRDIYKIIVMMVILVIIYLLMEFTIIPLLERFFPILDKYDKFFKSGIIVVIVFGGAAIVQKIAKNAIEYKSSKIRGKNYRGLYTIIRALIYGVAIAIILGALGVSVTGALLGGTVGGLILSYALQPTISNLLSGILLASVGIVKPKDRISFFSWLFDNPVVGEVIDVKTLTVDILTVDGNITQLPNSGLLGSTQFTNLDVNGIIRSTIDIALPVDAQISGIMQIARETIEKAKKSAGIVDFYPYFFTKNFNSNQIKVNFDYNSILDYNNIVNVINRAYEEAYWEMKNRAPQGNNIILGFPVDVSIFDIISKGNLLLDEAKESAGILSYSTTFFAKSSAMNSIKVKFTLKDSSISYDNVANAVNSSYEKAYLQLKAPTSK